MSLAAPAASPVDIPFKSLIEPCWFSFEQLLVRIGLLDRTGLFLLEWEPLLDGFLLLFLVKRTGSSEKGRWGGMGMIGEEGDGGEGEVTVTVVIIE